MVYIKTFKINDQIFKKEIVKRYFPYTLNPTPKIFIKEVSDIVRRQIGIDYLFFYVKSYKVRQIMRSLYAKI